jgi:Protein of unknown function, DUF547
MSPKTAVLVLVTVALIASESYVSTLQDYKPPPDLEPLHAPFDALLDLHVRDGLVYYRALQQDRERLSRYTASLNSPSVVSAFGSWDRDRQKAFWINAYNAFVLQTVVSHYPIRGRAPMYPADSVRQIPGAFEKLTHMAAGKSLTLDQIENLILTGFADPRVFLALGRGAVGSARLRSEAFGAKMLERQLDDARAQFVKSPSHANVDPLAGRVSISPIVSWRAPSFIEKYADDSFDLPKREPIERAVIGLLRPHLLPAEEEYIRKNSFQLTYEPFDWRLNDLTGGRPD